MPVPNVENFHTNYQACPYSGAKKKLGEQYSHCRILPQQTEVVD